MHLSAPRVAVFAIAVAVGCAEHRSLLERSGGSPSPHVFWPPPPPSSISSSPVRAPGPLVAAAARVNGALRGAGYADLRWYPVGVDYAHGFAVATRMERIDDDARAATARWDALYPDASNLRWLAMRRDPKLPGPGRYRVLVVAVTDLAAGPSRDDDASAAAPRWNAATWMDGPGEPTRPIPASRATTAAYATEVFVYEYAASGDDGAGRLVDDEDESRAAITLERAGLASLAK